MGVVVTCKVLSMSTMNARCSIYCIENDVLRQPFKGLIRKEDVRLLEKDRVELYKCFRPGDIVLARVIGVGENNNFLLTTAEDELGVAIAYSEESKNHFDRILLFLMHFVCVPFRQRKANGSNIMDRNGVSSHRRQRTKKSCKNS